MKILNKNLKLILFTIILTLEKINKIKKTLKIKISKRFT